MAPLRLSSRKRRRPELPQSTELLQVGSLLTCLLLLTPISTAWIIPYQHHSRGVSVERLSFSPQRIRCDTRLSLTSVNAAYPPPWNSTLSTHGGGTMDNSSNTSHQIALQAKSLKQLVTTARDLSTLSTKTQLMELVSSIGLALAESTIQQSTSSSSYLSLYTLSDVLAALATLVRRGVRKEKLTPMAQRVWYQLATYDDKSPSSSSIEDHKLSHAVYRLGPRRLAECLRAGLLFKLEDEAGPVTLYTILCNRLTKGDALSKLQAKDVGLTLAALLRQQTITDSTRDLLESDDMQSASSVQLAKALSRRLRKATIRSTCSRETILHVMDASRRFLQYATGHKMSTGGEIDLVNEVRTMVYTLLKELLVSRDSSRVDLSACTIHSLLRLTTLLDMSDTDDVFVALYSIIAKKNGTAWVANASANDLSGILSILTTFRKQDSPGLVLEIGNRFQELCLDSSQNDMLPTSDLPIPSISIGILRCAALLHGKDQTIMEPYLAACRRLFLDQEYLEFCCLDDLSNVAWFLYKAHCRDRELVHAFGHSALEIEQGDHCSTRTACRLLEMFTSIFAVLPASEEQVIENQLLLSQLFEVFGVYLLSPLQLSPRDISSSVRAYARASYLQDMGIFDQLVQTMASRLDEFEVRQIAECLWACGRMVAWENDGAEEEDLVAGYPQAPYLSHALELATRLAVASDDLSGKDVTQALTALGLMQVTDPEILQPISNRAKSIANDLTSREVANILWALGKLNSKDFDVIFALSRRFARTDLPKSSLTPQECSNVLYSLGRLNIRDEVIFENLTAILLARIDETSAQGIANCLWAHRVVHIPPPQKLIDSWASQKLGLVAVQPRLELFI